MKHWCLLPMLFILNSFYVKYNHLCNIFFFFSSISGVNKRTRKLKNILNRTHNFLDSSKFHVSNGLPRFRLRAVSSVDLRPTRRKSGNEDSWLKQDLQPRDLPMQEASVSPAATKQPHNNNSKTNKTTTAKAATTTTTATTDSTTSKTTQSHGKNQKLSGVSKYWLFQTI